MVERTLRLVAIGLPLLAAACSSGDGGIDGGGCDPASCADRCRAGGYAEGVCAGSMCQCSGSPDGGADADGDADPDGTADGDDGGGPEDAADVEVDPCAPAVCGPEELCGETGRGDGIDNDCDDLVDEVCTCGEIGTTLECFPGDPTICPPGMPCRGGCTRGIETCTEFSIWSGCVRAVTPSGEVCDGVDNDCDGAYDEDLDGCANPVTCPATRTAAPMSWVALDGTSLFPYPFDSWRWELFCPTTVPVCPAPEDPTAQDTQVFIVASGTYRVRVTIREGPDTFTCEYALVVQGAGLRVELTWDSQGRAAGGGPDVDLHLHKWGTPPSSFFDSVDDCYYANCKASSCCWGGPPEVAWGLPHTTDMSACADAPHGEGDEWLSHGFCANPRLDVDVITCSLGTSDPTSYDFCAPENINVDNPPIGEPMRVLVNYFSDHGYTGDTNATLNIYCGGSLRATFGPELLPYGDSSGSSNDNWLVADVRFYEGLCGTLDCEIVPLGLIQRGDSFGPPWSTFTH